MSIDINIDTSQLVQKNTVLDNNTGLDNKDTPEHQNDIEGECFEYNYSLQLKEETKAIIEEQCSDITWIEFDESLVENIPTQWVSNYTQLDELMDTLEGCTQVAFDTEFIKRNTYYPKLALIQVNTGDTIYLIDAPKLDLYDFWAVIADIPVIIWHACGEDLNIFYLLSDLPSLDNVFDTQIAMGFITGTIQLGYQKSIEQMLGVSVDKEQSQSNWLARPLTHEQEVYAINDVKYLLPMYHIIIKKLSELNIFSQVWEDCQLYANDLYQLYDTKDDEQYLSVMDARYTGIQRAFLKELLSWREKLARATNQPRTFILRKQAIRELADIMPTSLKKLKHDTTVHRSIIDTYGKEIIAIVHRVKTARSSDYPQAIIAPYRSKETTIQKAINTITNSYGEKTGIPVVMLLKKKWLAKVFEFVVLEKQDEYNELPLALQGWRAELIQQELIPKLRKFRQELRHGMNLDDKLLEE